MLFYLLIRRDHETNTASKIFTEEFKRDAIKLVTEQHLNAAQAGRQLDIHTETIYIRELNYQSRINGSGLEIA